MTLTAWGLILDIVGVLLIATSTFGASVDKSGFLTMKRWLPATLSSWATPLAGYSSWWASPFSLRRSWGIRDAALARHQVPLV